jgi:hypothetical protein
MNVRQTLCHVITVLSVFALLATPRPLDAQKPAPPIPPNPQAPVLTALSVTGVQRGNTIEVMLSGANLAGPTGVYTSFPAKVTIPTEDKNGQDNAKLRVRLEVPADAPMGYHTLRLATTRGISNLRLFCIDDLPQAAELGSNRDRATPQTLVAPCVVPGKVDAEKSTWFLINVKAGQRLSFDVLGRRLGSPIDPQISIYDVKTKREIAHDNDAPACQSDPRLQYTFKDAGAYLIEIKDVLNRGGADYFFRLRIGDFPLATVPIPMAVQRGKKATVTFAGSAVDGAAPVTVAGPMDPGITTLWVAPKGASGLHGWPVPLAVTDLPELVEREPNQEPSQAMRLAVPAGVTGRFLKGNETDHYVFAAKKGQKVLIEAHTLELGSPTLVYMVVRNPKTRAELAKSNPQNNPPADQVIDFTAPDDGDYLVEVQHLIYVGGPDEAYRLTLTLSRPSYEVSLGLDRFDLAPGSYAALPLLLKRNNFNGPVEVRVHGGGLSGKATFQPGQTSTVVSVQAPESQAMGALVITLVCEATIDKESVVQLVNVRPSVTQSLANLPFPPRELHTQIAIGVREKAPFKLSSKLVQDGVVPGLPATFKVSVERGKDFDGDIAVTLPAGLPPNVGAPKAITIPKGQNETTFKMDINPKLPTGELIVVFGGKGKQGAREFTEPAGVHMLDVIAQPFALKVEDKVKLTPGGTAKFRVIAQRKGGYDGPIALQIKNVPEKVKATAGTIAKGQDAVEIELTADAAAAAGVMAKLEIAGTATAFNNAPGTPATVPVTIEKKE